MWGQNGKILSLMIMLSHNHARKIVPCVLCQHWFLNWKKGFVDLFSQSVDFWSNCWLFDQNVDFLDLCKSERGYGSKLEQKCMRGKNGNKKSVGQN